MSEMIRPQVGNKAPDFKGTAVVNKEFKEISLKDYRGKWLCLFFYPLDFTFVCPTEIVAFSDRVEDFKKLGCEVVGASIDSAACGRVSSRTARRAAAPGAAGRRTT